LVVPWYRGWHFDKELRIFDALLTLATFAGLIFLGQQSYELQKQSTAAIDAARAAETQLRLTIGQLDAAFAGITSQEKIAIDGITAQREIAGKQLEVATRANTLEEQASKNAVATYQRENRARMIVDNINVPAIKADAPIQVMVRFKNTGKSHALNYRQTCQFEPMTVSPSFSPQYPEIPPRPTKAGSSVEATGASVCPMAGRRPLTADEAAALNAGTSRVYIWGRLRYDDAYGQRHDRRYCQSLNPSNRLLSPCIGNDPDD